MVYPMMYEENYDEVNQLLQEISHNDSLEEFAIEKPKLIFIGSGCDAPESWRCALSGFDVPFAWEKAGV